MLPHLYYKQTLKTTYSNNERCYLTLKTILENKKSKTVQKGVIFLRGTIHAIMLLFRINKERWIPT